MIKICQSCNVRSDRSSVKLWLCIRKFLGSITDVSTGFFQSQQANGSFKLDPDLLPCHFFIFLSWSEAKTPKAHKYNSGWRRYFKIQFRSIHWYMEHCKRVQLSHTPKNENLPYSCLWKLLENATRFQEWTYVRKQLTQINKNIDD